MNFNSLIFCNSEPFSFLQYVREFITLHDTQKLCLDWNIPENPDDGPVCFFSFQHLFFKNNFFCLIIPCCPQFFFDLEIENALDYSSGVIFSHFE